MSQGKRLRKNGIVHGADVERRVEDLKDFLEMRIDNLDRMLGERITAVERGITHAESEMKNRLEGMNEFREQLRAQASTFVTKGEYDLSCDRTEDDIRSLREFRATIDAKASQSAVNVAYILNGLALAVAVLSVIISILR